MRVIFVFGTICIDRLRRVPFLPQAGGYVEIRDEAQMLGGEAANTANALSTWGAEVALAGNGLGTGPDSDLLRQLLIEKGLPTSLLPQRDDDAFVAPVCDVYVTDDGDRTMFGKGFSRMRMNLPIEAMPFRAGDWFTAEPNMGDRARAVVRAAIAAGMKPYLMDFLRDDEPIIADSFWQSSTDWAGFRNNAQKNVRWVREFVERRGCFAILSDGPNGFVAGSPQQPVRAYPSFPAPEVVDTTGAGDMFRAGMLFGVSSGWAVPDCLRFAAAAGCLKCRSLGATTYVPSEDEVKAHIAANPEVARQYQ